MSTSTTSTYIVNVWKTPVRRWFVDFLRLEGFVKTEYIEVKGSSTTVTETPTETPADTSTTAAAEGTGEKVTIKDTVNVRKSASETGDKLGVAYQGEHYELIMKQADGWTKIKFNGQTGFVKSEYIQ